MARAALKATFRFTPRVSVTTYPTRLAARPFALNASHAKPNASCRNPTEFFAILRRKTFALRTCAAGVKARVEATPHRPYGRMGCGAEGVAGLTVDCAGVLA